MRSFWYIVLLVMVLTVFLAVSCNETETEEDGSASTYEQKTPSDRAEPTDSKVTETDSDTAASDAIIESDKPTDGTESADGVTDKTVEENNTIESEEGMASESKSTGNIIVLETTKGDIVIQLREEWSPLGVAHFKELVNSKFYDGAPWFRVIDGFVAQCGVSADPKLNQELGEKTINDEPVVKGNLRGTVVYGKTGMPNSRSTHFYINLVDNSAGLDRQGFSAFGEVIEGMDIADKLTRCEYGDQAGLAAPGGLDKFKATYPNADYIKRAYIK